MSEIRANTISDAAGTGPVTLTKQSAAKAWVNFDGSAGTISPRDSFNVSSLTDHAQGNYTATFTDAFAAADYSISTSARYRVGTSNEGSGVVNTQAAGSARFMAVAAGVLFDSSIVCMTAHGDLA